MRAIVTGSSGFIGRAFNRYLRSHGWTVLCVDTATGWDCRDAFGSLTPRFDLLVHAAAVIGSRQERDENPLAVYENLSLDQAAIAFARRTGTPLLYFSSSAAYRTDRSGPFVESDIEPDRILSPDASYGFIKLVGERQCGELRAQGSPVYVARPFSGYGEDQSADYPFRAICDRVRRREDPLDVWSDTERDFIHVDDVVGACLAMVERGVFGPVNIGTGIPTRMTRLARMAATAAGYEPEIRVLDRSPGPDHRYADIGAMREFYAPRVDLMEGIERTLCGSHRLLEAG